jgi:hypothetical protein
LTRERLEAWLGEFVTRDTHHRAVEQSIATIRAMLSTAVAWDRIATNPTAHAGDETSALRYPILEYQTDDATSPTAQRPPVTPHGSAAKSAGPHLPT